MGRTARVVLVSGSIVCLLGLTAVLAGALPAARDGVAASPSLLAPPSAPGAPPALRVGEQGLGLAQPTVGVRHAHDPVVVVRRGEVGEHGARVAGSDREP